jgi:hypothetical protein
MRKVRPFNMLAILAKVNNRKFEAVYYHVGCLSSRNPFQSSNEGVVTIFEEMQPTNQLQEYLCNHLAPVKVITSENFVQFYQLPSPGLV